MPEPSLEWARMACETARSLCTLKSDNKKNPGWTKPKENRVSVDREVRLVEAHQALLEIRAMKAETGEKFSVTIRKRAEAAMKKKAGNCTELSCIAFSILASEKVFPLELVTVKDPGDHMFLVMGLARPIGEVEKDMTKWGHKVFICDPWAHIYTRAYLYENWWRVRMTMWAEKNKKVKLKGDWKVPTDEMWFTSINQGKKEVLYSLDK